MDESEFTRQLARYRVVRGREWIESEAERRAAERRRARSGGAGKTAAAAGAGKALLPPASGGGAGGKGVDAVPVAAGAGRETGSSAVEGDGGGGGDADAAAPPPPLTLVEAEAYTDFWAGLRIVLQGALGATRGAAAAAAYEDRHYAALKTLSYEDIEELCRYIETVGVDDARPAAAAADPLAGLEVPTPV